MAYTTINKSTDNFNTVTYTGNGSTQSITGVGFQPDWVWIKARNYTRDHRLLDAVRGVQKEIYSNETYAENTVSTSITSFDSDGFTAGGANGVNANSETHVAWNWKANGSGSSNSDGDITSTVQANTTAGFSIVSYTGSGTIGDTVGHGLGQKPAMVITKNRDNTSTWVVWHQGGTSTKNTALNSNEPEHDSGASGWSQGINGVPTSSVLTFTAGSAGNNNVMDSGEKYISYCFAEKTGYSKFGSYTANGSADGTFVYTGFAPKFIILKRTDTSGYNWVMMDNKINTYNPWTNLLLPNEPNAQIGLPTNLSTDFLSNGFKLRSASGANPTTNQGTIIYMAFGQSLVGSNNVPCTAR